MQTELTIRRMLVEDIDQAARVHERAFPRQTFSRDWVDCAFQAFPKIQFFVATKSDQIVGIVFWTEKSGFRKEAVVELEQIAVDPDFQGQGIGCALIKRSLPQVAKKISERGASLKHLLVNTRADNYARHLYEKTMGVVPVAVVSGMFTADEVYLAANNVVIDPNAEVYELSRI